MDIRSRATPEVRFETGSKPAKAFLFQLISQLQFGGTVPMIDVGNHGRWLTK